MTGEDGRERADRKSKLVETLGGFSTSCQQVLHLLGEAHGLAEQRMGDDNPFTMDAFDMAAYEAYSLVISRAITGLNHAVNEQEAQNVIEAYNEETDACFSL